MCGGRGLCDCGRPCCAIEAWWVSWLGAWKRIGRQVAPPGWQRDAMTDDDISYLQEQEA